ncbi:MAG: hypothetical protein IT350_05865 [Deltaproteobacteria bacterium]|nr:hypothetical protein [Deltaproteobacteria bacterium]
MGDDRKRRRRFGRALVAAVVTFVVLAAFAPAAFAQTQDQRTLFVIGNINSAFGTFPLRAYNIVDDTIVLANTWYPAARDDGAVGIGVDPVNAHMFVTYENLDLTVGVVDVYDATDATPLGQISLVGTTNLAGIDVHAGRGVMYVVDRCMPTIYTFDTDTFQPIDSWDMPTSSCAYGIDVIDEEDLIFVADASNTVHWYDIDTHEEVGSATLTYPSASIAVDYSEGYPVIYTSCVDGQSEIAPPGDVPYLVKYNTNTDTQTTYYLGANQSGRGIGLDVVNRRAYIAAGVVGGLASGTIRVVDMDTMTELSRSQLPGGFGTPWSPTDLETTWLAFGSNIQKTSPTHPDGEIEVGQQITFEITIENRYSRPIHVLPFKDDYDPAHLTFVSATPTPDNVDTVNGVVEWNDLIPSVGHDMEFEETYTVTVVFEANPPDSCETWVDGTNTGIMSGAENDRGDVLDESSGSMAYRIWCTCQNDEECDNGLWCDGEEQCLNRECVSLGNPCPIDDGIFCNGEETLVCVEETQECGHSGDPCADDGNLCNGVESCNEEAGQCENTGDPCTDDGEYCNGDEFCDPTKVDCRHSGNPCDEDETCNEPTDECLAPGEDPGLDKEPGGDKDEDAGWPEGQVTGGCCGCGDNGKDD